MNVATERDPSAYPRLAAEAGLEFVRLEEPVGPGEALRLVNPLAVRMLSEAACRQFEMVPIAYDAGVVTLAVADPFSDLAQQVASALLGRRLRFVVALPDEIRRAVDGTYLGHDAEGAENAEGEQPKPDIAVRLGDLLIARDVATPEQIDEALEEQKRVGSRLGEILVNNQIVREEDLLGLLADQFDVPLVDLTGFDPDPEAIDEIPEPVARRLRCVPLAREGDTLYLAISDRLDEQTLAVLRQHTSLELRGMLAPRNAVDELLQRVHRDAYVATACFELLNRSPEECANRVVTGAQRAFFVAVAVAFLVLLVFFTVPAMIGFIALCSLFYTTASLYKFWITFAALSHHYETDVTPADIAALDEHDCPMYTILVPLYREAAVVPKLVQGIEGLDYPRSRLDVRLLCEEDDDETIPAIRALGLPPHFKLVVVPDAQPKTKPKACNYGLLQAEGKYVVIFDAEDRPDPDQLKKIVIAFQNADPSVTCVQAKLNYFNQDQNLLTRWFSTEYAMWFDLILPGLDAEDVPIPLGGTSNHFVLERLVELGGWDAFNVTEDADLGIRLHKAGYKTAIIDSTTLEEANSEINNWIRQRSRWIKGYIQTWLVHMRHPFKLLRTIGPKNWMSFQLLVGGTFIFLLNPIFWGLTTVFFFTKAGIIHQLFPSVVFYAAALQLFVGNFGFVLLNIAGAHHRGYYSLIKYALASPLYWGLMSIAAWKGFIQLFTKPFYWEKTVHGLDSSTSG